MKFNTLDKIISYGSSYCVTIVGGLVILAGAYGLSCAEVDDMFALSVCGIAALSGLLIMLLGELMHISTLIRDGGCNKRE